MSDRDLAQIRRILLALDASVHSSTLLEATIRLAAMLDVELQALFVEDINLLRLAGLPFARETRLTSATTRRLQHPEMERALRAQAGRAQEELAAAATRLNVRWSFRVTRGTAAAEVAEAALQTDLVAFTLSPGTWARLTHAEAAAETLLALPPGAGLRPPFVAVYDGTPPSVRALALAAQLAQPEDGELLVLIAAPGEEARAPLYNEAEERLKEIGVSGAHLRVLPAADTAALASAVRFARAGTLVLAANSPLLAGGAVLRLLERLGCAALLVR